VQEAIFTDDMADRVALRSEELFKQGLFCAESVLQAVAESQNIENDLIPRIATGFCSGIARTNGLCGAAGGAILAINMLCGRDDTTSTVEGNYNVVRDFIRRFEAEFGSVNCYQLIGCRLDTPEGQAFFKENNLWDKCLVFTREAGRFAISSIQAANEEEFGS
jgi:C_GCAxxG_C_C family probable redox protein